MSTNTFICISHDNGNHVSTFRTNTAREIAIAELELALAEIDSAIVYAGDEGCPDAVRTSQRLFAPTLAEAAGDVWRFGNDAGEGFAPADDYQSWDCRYAAANTSEVSVYDAPNGDVVIVGDANGPWAVRA